MSELAGLLQTLEPGHRLMAAGGVLILLGLAEATRAHRNGTAFARPHLGSPPITCHYIGVHEHRAQRVHGFPIPAVI
jgi:hypothetical protein